MTPERWQKIEQLCHAALEREAYQRGAFLEEACRGDNELLSEVESLMAREKTAEGFLVSGGAEAAANVWTKMQDENAGRSMIGRQLGSYQVICLLGVGGMGEVYQALDTKLRRDVAIKVLPSAFVHDPERLARFQREARMLAALNHPHIATIHGLEQSDGIDYFVMELVPGDTLADRIKREGAVPVDEALGMATQVAEALEAAHEKGIIHRDLKPANVKVTRDGKVKVLDFGLAKAFTDDATEADPANSPTISRAETKPGAILGTPAYMSPEQARGMTVDKRTDIWAIGCVLYEMLTGVHPFPGADVTEILAAVVKSEPDWSRLPEDTPSAIRVLLRRCLQKDRSLRLRDAGDMRLEIQEALAAPNDVVATQTVSVSRNKLPWVVAAGFAVATLALGALFWRTSHPVELKPLMRLDVDLGVESSSEVPVRGADVILSPDGTRLVYESNGKLYIRKVDQLVGAELAGTEGAYAPFFSPDGQWIAFFEINENKLKKISVDGGAPAVLCDAPYGFGGSWGEDGNIIASISNPGALSRVPLNGDAPTPVMGLIPGEATERWPQILPGGKAVLFTSYKSLVGADETSIEVISLNDRHRKTVQRGGTFGRYVATSNRGGHLVYMKSGTLFAVAFDLDALEVRGAPIPVVDQIAYNAANGSAQLEISQTGILMYRMRGAATRGQVTVQWLDSAGDTQPLLAKPGDYRFPHLSPDGQRLALEMAVGPDQDVWSYEWQRSTMTRLTFDVGGGTLNPVWSTDGHYVVSQGKQGGIFWTRSDGGGKPQPLTQSKTLQLPFSFTRDGKRLSYMEPTEGLKSALWTVPIESDGTGLRAGQPELFLKTAFDNRQPMFSPDGHWMAYASDESGNLQVYVRAFPDTGSQWQISNGGGQFPVWSRNGRELFFRSPDNRIMVASYMVKGGSMTAEKPRVWSQKRMAPGFSTSFDIAPDGKRIAMLMQVETPEMERARSHVIFLENFFDELKRKVPLNGK